MKHCLTLQLCVKDILTLSVPDEGYSRNVSCILNLISTFLLHYRNHKWGTVFVEPHYMTYKILSEFQMLNKKYKLYLSPTFIEHIPEHLSSPPVFSGVRVYSIFSFIYMFCRSLFVLLYFFFWPLCCLFFDIRILIAPLVSSNSS